jgi:hypothetical protein
MPLPHYGVCIGTQPRGDDPEQGRWYHGVFTVEGAGQQYTCTVDLESRLQADVQYSVRDNLSGSAFAPILSLGEGYTELARNASSGALDYVRSPFVTPGCLALFSDVFEVVFGTTDIPWTTATGQDAVNVLIPFVTNAAVSKLFVFGEPFTEGYGMHNVHMNQGDPPLSPDGMDHQGLDGIWQDGGTIVQKNDGTLHAFLSKFPTQSMQTNDQGLPL